ncbi:MAG TPA: murein biosynthesis integral membrane protein MurJ [Mycobacteriales bacterium]|nr:murein biosynthesis integral membrane protein MurJ [Mycobacteriales bacterium]
MSLLRSARGMAVGTAASRATGFLRTVSLATVLGVQGVGAAFAVANAAPHIVYELLLGGVLTSVVVPLLVRAAKEDGDGGDAYAQRLLTVTVLVLGAAAVVLVLAAPALIDLYAGELSRQSRDLAVVFARFFLPQVLLYGVGAVLGAVLNTRGHFSPPMWAPVLNNLVVVATCGLFLLLPGTSPLSEATITDTQVAVLGVGATLGILAQTVALLPALRACGFRLRLRTDVRGAGLSRIWRLGSWVLLYVVANQLAYLVVVRLAAAENLVADGRGYPSYVNAFILWQLPHAIVAVSVITALLPSMSRAAADERLGDLRDELGRGLRLTVALLLPAAVGYLVLGRSLGTALFAHGEVSVEQARYIGLLLGVFAFGLVPFSVYQLQLRAFYALQDTRTATMVNLGVNAALVLADVALYVALPDRFEVAGLAAGHALSFVVGLAVCSAVLRRRIGGGYGGPVLSTAWRCGLAAAAAGVAAYAVVRPLEDRLGVGPGAAAVVLLGGGVVLLGSYVLIARVARLDEVTSLIPRRATRA